MSEILNTLEAAVALLKKAEALCEAGEQNAGYQVARAVRAAEDAVIAQRSYSPNKPLAPGPAGV